MATAIPGRKTKRRRSLGLLWLTQQEGKIKFLAFTVATLEADKALGKGREIGSIKSECLLHISWTCRFVLPRADGLARHLVGLVTGSSSPRLVWS